MTLRFVANWEGKSGDGSAIVGFAPKRFTGALIVIVKNSLKGGYIGDDYRDS